MDAIKKKMQAMKLEKDNALDRALVCEQQARDANIRAEKVIIYLSYSIYCSMLFINAKYSYYRSLGLYSLSKILYRYIVYGL